MNISSEHIDRIDRVLENLETDLETRGEALGERLRGTELLIRILAAIMGVVALANLYFVNDLTQEIRVMIGSMNEMTGHFADVSRRMDRLSSTVASMTLTVGMMPIMADQLDEISGHVESMGRDVTRMAGSTATIDERIRVLNRDTLDMAGRFRSVNEIVRNMGIDVDQMARPMP